MSKELEVDKVVHEERVAQTAAFDSLEGLRRVPDKIPTAAWFIIINEFCERFAYYGGSAPFTNYVQFGPNDPEQAGALDMGQGTSNALKQFFTFFCYFTPLIGAVISDQYLGKYRTIMIFSLIYSVGWIILTLTSIPEAIKAGAGLPGYIVALIVIGFGTGGIKPLVSPMAADQYPNKQLEVRVIKGERVVVDPELSTQHLYNWFYWSINIGSLIGGILSPQLEVIVGFWLSYLVPAVMFLISVGIFVMGRKRYTHVPPSGESTIVKGWKCYSYGLRRYRKATIKPASPLDAAKDDPSETEAERASKMWDDTFVDDLKQTLMACKIFIPLTVYWVSYNQITSNLLSQAAAMDLPRNIPNDIMSNINPIALLIFIPLLDVLVYPFLRKVNLNPRPMVRITLGFMLGALAMMASAIVQNEVYRRQDLNLPKLNVWWQIPAYVLIALSEIFASITSIEYSYTHAPDSLKGLVSAMALLPNALSALITIFLTPISQDPYLTWNYGGIAIVTFVVGGLFWWGFRHYDDIDEETKKNRTFEISNSEKSLTA